MAWELDVRRKIQTSNVCNRLIEHVNGQIKLEPSQVQAALGLMRKVLPDLATHTVSSTVDAKLTLQRIERVIIDAMPAPQLTIDNDGKDTSVN